jgi:hypothetical protein
MHPVLNESIFNKEIALYANDIERTFVRSADFRLAVDKMYRMDGIMPIGKSKIEGVLRDKETSSTAK